MRLTQHLIAASALALSAIAGTAIPRHQDIVIMDLTYINVGAVALAGFLALVNNRIVEYLIVPIFERLGIDRAWLLYTSAGTGLLIALLANVDLFMPGLFISPIISKILSAIIIAGGSNLIHDVVGRPGQSRRQHAIHVAKARL